MDTVVSNRIVLDSYAEVLHLKDTYSIVVHSLPKGYKKADLYYSSNKPDIASVTAGKIIANSPGNAQILVKTNDDKYTAYINILVSDS